MGHILLTVCSLVQDLPKLQAQIVYPVRKLAVNYNQYTSAKDDFDCYNLDKTKALSS